MGILGWIVGLGIAGSILSKVKEAAAEEKRRKSIQCYFDDGITEEEFIEMVKQVEKKIKRIKKLKLDGAVVYGKVRSNSGISEWNFNVDFNDYGHLSGKYWIYSDNDDSDIPRYVAETLSSAIKNYSSSSTCYENNFESGTKYCTYCGEKITTENAKYCSYCGNIL